MKKLPILKSLLLVIGLYSIFFISLSGYAADPRALTQLTNQEMAEDTRTDETIQLPDHLGSAQIDSIVAKLNDAQVRRLLIDELKEEAAL